MQVNLAEGTLLFVYYWGSECVSQFFGCGPRPSKLRVCLQRSQLYREILLSTSLLLNCSEFVPVTLSLFIVSGCVFTAIYQHLLPKTERKRERKHHWRKNLKWKLSPFVLHSVCLITAPLMHGDLGSWAQGWHYTVLMEFFFPLCFCQA